MPTLSRVFSTLRHAASAATLVLAAGSTAAAQVALDVQVSRTNLTAGDTLRIGVDLQSPGNLPTADIVLAVVLPDGQAVSVRPGGPVFGRLADLRSLVPFLRGVNLAAPFNYRNPTLFSHALTGSEPAGLYTVYFALLRSGALDDGALGGGELVGLDVATFTVRGRVTTSVDAARVARAEVGVAGGTIATSAADGTAFTLTLAANALGVATPLAIAPLTSASNLPPGLRFVAGVRAGPGGTTFQAPVSLAVTLPPGAPTSSKGYIGFVADDVGSRLERVAVIRTGDQLTMAVPHFSDVVIASADDLLVIDECEDAGFWSPQMALACSQLTSLYGSGVAVDAAFRAEIAEILQTWLTTGLRPRAAASIDDTPTADDTYRKILIGELPLFTMTYAAFFGDPWFGAPDRPLAAGLDSFFIDMDTALLAYQARQIAACLADKDALLHGYAIDATWVDHATLFKNVPDGRDHCVRLVIEAQPTVVPSGGTAGTVLTEVRLEFTDGSAAPGYDATITATVSNGTVSPAGGADIPLPIAGPLTVVLNPGATSMALTITAATNLFLPTLTRTFYVTSSAPPVIFNGGFAVETAGVETFAGDGVPLTDAFDIRTTVAETMTSVDRVTRAQLPPGQPVNPPLFAQASADFRLRVTASATSPFSMTMSGGVGGSAYVLASVTNGSAYARTSGRVEHNICFTLTGPSTLTYTLTAGNGVTGGVQLLRGETLVASATRSRRNVSDSLPAAAGTYCVLGGIISGTSVNTLPMNRNRSHGMSYTAFISVGPP